MTAPLMGADAGAELRPASRAKARYRQHPLVHSGDVAHEPLGQQALAPVVGFVVAERQPEPFEQVIERWGQGRQCGGSPSVIPKTPLSGRGRAFNRWPI
jgi:hypothetical protein